jgi:hypothetical protein
MRGLWLRGSPRNIPRSGRVGVVLNSSIIEKDPEETGRIAEIMTE